MEVLTTEEELYSKGSSESDARVSAVGFIANEIISQADGSVLD